MAGMDKSTARAIAVIALLFVTAWALRGYLPGVERVVDRQRPPSSPAALIVDIALLSISVAIIGIAIITRLRGMDQAPDEVQVEFGLDLHAEAGAFIAAASATANFKIVMTWRQQSGPASSQA